VRFFRNDTNTVCLSIINKVSEKFLEA
ncbi:uncharacterized protein METZ01_LOCUS336671, partial [marine metagenome]